jgi:hypothetical protein
MIRYVAIGTLWGILTVFALSMWESISFSSISEGYKVIMSNPWSRAAWIDYLVGLVFAVPLLIQHSPGLWGFLLAVSNMILGNGILVIWAIWKLFKSETLVKAWSPPISPSGSNGWIQAYRLLSAVAAIYYFFSLRQAFMEQPMSEGWTFIKKNPWAMTTFLDNLCGIVVTLWYIGAREGPHSIYFCLFWLLLITFLGNGVTVSFLRVSWAVSLHSAGFSFHSFALRNL